MTASLRRVGAAAVALVSMLAIGALSRAPYTADRGERALLRLAWRARGERVEECRRLSPDELARLPPHMRQEEQCEEHMVPYRLQVSVDGVRRVDEVVHAAGARRDRPLYVYRELPLDPGTHAVAISFVREGAIPRGARERVEGTPARLACDTTVTVAARRVLLATYDDEGRRLVLRGDLPP